MRRPVIAICSALERARWAVWDQQAALVPMSYAEAVQRAGGIAVILPPDAGLVTEPRQALELFDGLLLAGGTDIDPGSYDQEPHPETVDTVPERDAFEIALTREAIARDLPVLGICRGMQLHQRRLRRHARAAPSRSRGPRGAQARARLLRGRRPRRRARPGLARRERGRRARARDALASPPGGGRARRGPDRQRLLALDELPEAIELPGRRFVLGVQWHPEADVESPVVAAFVQACSEPRSGSQASSGGASAQAPDAQAPDEVALDGSPAPVATDGAPTLRAPDASDKLRG